MIELETNTISASPFNQNVDINNMVLTQSSVVQPQKAGDMICDNGTLVFTVISELNNVKQRMEELENKQKKSEKFFEESALLSKTTRIVMLLLMLMPLLQLVACAVVVYWSGCDDKLSGFLKWIIGSVSAFSLVEMVIGGVKIYLLDKQIEDLKSRVDDIGKK